MRGEIIKIPRNSTLYIFPFLLLLSIFRHFNDHPQSGKGLRTCCEIINLSYTFFTCVQSEFEKKEGRKNVLEICERSKELCILGQGEVSSRAYSHAIFFVIQPAIRYVKFS